MIFRSSLFVLSFAVAVSAFAVHAAGQRAEARNEAAVLTASDDWLAAERRGDVSTLEQRLMPEYRDILPDGTVHPRSALINHAATLKDPSTLPARQLAAEFRKAHPVIEKAIIEGDTALLSYYSTDPRLSEQVRSLDVFVYDHGRWRALVSTHNSYS